MLLRLACYASVIGLLTAAPDAWAQSERGLIEGIVFDQTGAVIPDATVVARGPYGRSERPVVTGADGRFRLDVPAGTWELTVTTTQFEPLVQDAVVVAPGQRLELRLTLRVPAVAQEVVVSGQVDRPESMTVLTASEMRGEFAGTMNDYLFSGLPGVATARRSNLGFSGPGAGFYIRGLTNTRVAVFVDGVPSQVNSHGHPRSDQYSPDLIERAVITRGPSAVRHGASAVGGVIDLYTRTPGRGPSGSITTEGGELDTFVTHGDFGYGWNGGSVLVGAAYRNTDAQALGEELEERNLNVKLTQSITNGWTAGFRYSNTREFPSERFSSDPDQVLFRFAQDLDMYVVTLNHRAAGSRTLIAGHFNVMDTESFRETRSRGRFRVVPRDETEYGALARHTWMRGGGRDVTVGVHAVTYADRRTNFDGSAPAQKNREGHVSPHVHATQPLGERTILDGGLRLSFSGQFGTDAAPEVGVVHRVVPDVAVRARAGRAFRVPRVDEVNAPFNVANDDLNPEAFYHAEAGVHARVLERVEIDVAGWWMRGDNLIQTIGSGATARSVNTGEFRHRGLEAIARFRVIPELALMLGGNVMHTPAAQAVPQKTLDLGGDLRLGRFRGTITGRFAADNTTEALDDYFVADTRLSYRVVRGLEVLLDILNVTDEEYATLTGFGGPIQQVPRTVLVGARYTLP